MLVIVRAVMARDCITVERRLRAFPEGFAHSQRFRETVMGAMYYQVGIWEMSDRERLTSNFLDLCERYFNIRDFAEGRLWAILLVAYISRALPVNAYSALRHALTTTHQGKLNKAQVDWLFTNVRVYDPRPPSADTIAE
ncbi:MAG TPA: hypothetical protein VFW65_32155 [Pseudonocardiaceae bacterium]|nr:hypothetical protein [Pseudonocardiaceae bacterium]